ncbi:phosphotransferase enzyme domain protein, partial [bacterium]|nr:phosphotransferase enzyme domain protein [bacterium]
MKIGIDFDNTMAKYDKVFINAAIEKNFISPGWSGNKELLKKELYSQHNQWETLQGLVYGPLMRKAVCFPGLKKFLSKANFSNHKIFIISHKTIYGHFDKTKTKLR